MSRHSPILKSRTRSRPAFGVLRIPTEIATDIIRNDGTLDQYKAKIDSFIEALTSSVGGSSKGIGTQKARLQKSELHRTLSALNAIGHAGTCETIAAKASELGHPVRKYNTNRALKGIPEFAEK